MTEFNSMTPSDINSRSVESVLECVPDKADRVPSKQVRLNVTKMLYDVLGYDLSADVALASVAEPQALLVLSTAGGGKTTWSQIKAIMQKILRVSKKGNGKKISGASILCLVYNRHNVDDMKLKHRQMVNRLQVAGIGGLDIDDQINACTMHSFCEFWRKKFVAKLQLFDYTLLDEEAAVRMMKRSVNITCKKMGSGNADDIDEVKVLGLYNLARERMCEVSELVNTDKFSDLDIDVELLECIFERYNSSKNLNKKYDYTDMLSKLYNLLLTDKECLAEVQTYYEYVIADEVQDFTPLMWALLKLFVSDGTPLTCIGDEDQNIYKFRGADIYTILDFPKLFDDCGIYLLNQNRRCRKAILDLSKRVLDKNTLRFNKQIIGCKDGGSVEYRGYSTVEGQIYSIVSELEKKSPDELQNTVVCYRDSVYSALLTDVLEERGVTFHVIRGRKPLSHELYRHVIDVLNILEMPCDRHVLLNLYKVLPCSRDKIYSVLGYNPEKRKFITEDEKTHFAYYRYGDLLKITGFVETMEVLIDLSNKIENTPLCEIFPIVFDLLQKYFWKYKKTNNSADELDEIFEQRVKKVFCVDQVYSKVFADLSSRRSVCNSDDNVGAGVAVATFHSLKGLEFNTVYTIFMDNSVFPNFELIESRGYPEKIVTELKESETRLWYVAVTRAIDKLIVYYPTANPSLYVRDELDVKASKRRIDLDDSVSIEQQSVFACNASVQSGGEEEENDFFLDDDDLLLEEREDTDSVVCSVEQQSSVDESGLTVAAESSVGTNLFSQSIDTVNKSSYMDRLLGSL